MLAIFANAASAVAMRHAARLRTPTGGRRAVSRMLAEDDDLALLGRRIGELKAVHTVRGIVLPEVMLPGQRTRLTLMPPQLSNLLRANKTVAVLGMCDDAGTRCS